MTAVFKKELRASYGNLTAAIASAAMLLVFGLMFRYYNLYNGALTYHYTVSSSVLLFYIAVPVLTMRSFADEFSKHISKNACYYYNSHSNGNVTA